jgi:hypothetical protein
MHRWMRGVCLAIVGLGLMVALTGCHKREHHKVQVHEEQREGPVQEDQPGEMIVE